MGSLASREDHPGELKSLASLREGMVERDIAARGVRDELVLAAMRKVPRELFLPKNLREFAYEDLPLPIAGGQTISQPYIVAFMAESLLLKGAEKILEIGAGSGYAAAVLRPWWFAAASFRPGCRDRPA
jgi:protein-L-isoaspartate(D-aspartate) O-methyltransferase